MRVLGTTACSIVALILSSCGGSTSSSEGMLGEIPAYYEKQGLDFCAQVSEIGKASGYSQDQETGNGSFGEKQGRRKDTG